VFLWSWRIFAKVVDVEQTMADLTGAVPDWVTGTLSIIYGVGAVYTIGLVIAVLFQWKQRRDAIRDMVLAGLTTGLIVTLLVRAIHDAWPLVFPETGLADPAVQFPILRVALVAAILTAVSPHLTRPMRRLGTGVILLVAFSGFAIGFGLPSSAIGAVALGLVAASGVLLVFGSPAGYPDLTSIADGLRGLGVGAICISTMTNRGVSAGLSVTARRLAGWRSRRMAGMPPTPSSLQGRGGISGIGIPSPPSC